MKKVLVIAAHADDEVLGCGGTIAKHVDIGDIVSLVVLADGVTSRESFDHVERESSLSRSCRILGIQNYVQFDFPDNRLDSVPLLDIVKKVESFIGESAPDVIYTHSYHDLNVDHQVAHRVAMTLSRPQYGRSYPLEIYSFYVPSSTEWSSPSMGPRFSSTRFVDVSKYYNTKTNAIRCYEQEMRKFPHPRSEEGVEVLCKYFGMQIGSRYAEGFIVERIIEL